MVRVTGLLRLIPLAFAIAFGACGDEPGPGEPAKQTMPASPVGALSMGGGALGGNAVTTELARVVLDEAPPGEVAWVAHEVPLAAGASIEHSHQFAFAYAREGSQSLAAGAAARELREGEGAAVTAGEVHRHGAVSGTAVLWEIRLAAPGSAPPGGALDSRLVFESSPLEEIPAGPMAAFVHVLVPPDGRTSVHTHPGPEFIYQISGKIEYQNAIIGSLEMSPGDAEGIPPETPVQKRNPFEGDAAFLSWFLVDTSKPFASPARFSAPAGRGENLALVRNGGRVAAVSSNFGGGGNEGTWGARNAIDGDPGTQWSSDGDGDNAWIEVELPSRTRVTSIGFWTRTMGSSAQISSFRIKTEGGETHGPFKIGDANSVHYFDVELTTSRLRFEAVETSGGNTGAVEIEVFGEPAQ